MVISSKHVVRALLAVGLIFAGVGTLLSRTPSVLKEMSLQKDGNRLQVLFMVEGTFSVEASFLPQPPRLLIDLTPVSGIQVLPLTPINDQGVIDVRIGQAKAETVRIMCDLEARFPAYEIIQTSEGLKIAFWYEEGVPPSPAPAETVQPAEKPAPAQAVAAEPAAPGRSGFFLAGRAGLSFFPATDLSVQRTFGLYGETATLDEAYSFGVVPAFELQFGKYFGRTKIGLGVSAGRLKQPGAFTAVLPHPFFPNTPRTVAFSSGDLNDTIWEISIFALFSIMRTKTFALAAGPMIGLNLGEMQSLANFDLTEEPPYDAANVAITNMIFVKDRFTEPSLGVVLNCAYRLSEGLSLQFDLRAVYLNPRNPTLGQRAYLLHLQPLLGIQYDF